MRTKLFFILIFLATIPCFSSTILRENLSKANAGDYIVTAQSKSYTVLLVESKENNILKIQEITVPMTRVNLKGFSWKQWIEANAPNNTSWVQYTIDLNNATMKEYYSFTKKGYYQIDEANNFLSKLISLDLEPIPDNQRKRVGPRPPFGADTRKLWQPQMVVDGQYITGVQFSAWRTRWPKDQTELADKTIEVYIPQDNQKYPSYFPYWLQVCGMVGKAKIRIIDSGMGAKTPQHSS